MTTGATFHLIDYSGLTPTVSQAQFNNVKADNDEYALTDFDLKATKIMDAGIKHYGIVPAKAGAILINADSTEAFKAWGVIYKGEVLKSDLKSVSDKVVPFHSPVPANANHVARPFMAAAADNQGINSAPKLSVHYGRASAAPSTEVRTMGLENNGIAA